MFGIRWVKWGFNLWRNGVTTKVDDAYRERERRNELRKQWEEFDGRLSGQDGNQSASTRAMRMRRFDAQMGYYASQMQADRDVPLSRYLG